MTPGQSISLALRSIRRSRLRSFFMMLGVTIGIASLTALASVGEATKQETMRRFKRMLGTFDMVIVQPGSSRTRGMPTLASVEPVLKPADGEAIATELATVKQVAQMQFALDLDVKYRDRAASPSVIGVSANWTEVRKEDVATGAGISEDDIGSLARVAVIGADVRQSLFPDEDPIGKTVRIADIPFQVKGVLAHRGVGPGGASMDNLMIIPVTTASKRLFNRDYLTSLIVQLKDPERAEQAMRDITGLLRERHGIAAGADSDFTVTSPAAQVARVTSVGSTLSRIMIGVAAIATLIGGVVIMSLMLISVSERRREIGVRRAVGATRRDILRQFLVEAAAVGLLGGILGIVVGVGGTLLVTTVAKLPPAVMWSAVAGAVALSLGVGVLFGLQPAMRAAATDPIEALRS